MVALLFGSTLYTSVFLDCGFFFPPQVGVMKDVTDSFSELLIGGVFGAAISSEFQIRKMYHFIHMYFLKIAIKSVGNVI